MKKSLNAWAVDKTVGFEETFKAVKNAGFDGIELNFDPSGARCGAHSLKLETYMNNIPQIRELSEKYSLPVVSVSSSLGWTYHIGSLSDRDAARRAFEAQLTAAKLLDAGGILTLPDGVGENGSLLRARELSLDFYESERDFIKDCGLTVGVENVWNGFFMSPFDVLSFIRDADNQLIKAYFDVGNVYAFSSPEHWIEVLGKNIGFIHVKDYKRQKGVNSGGEFCDLKTGGIDWDNTITALRTIGFDGYLTAEVTKRNPDISFEEFYSDVNNILDSFINH